ncbi:uncharacterized protein CXorf49-like [Erethizon dorsatum]
MSSRRDVSSRGTGFGVEDRKHTKFHPAGAATSRARDPALDLGLPRSGEGEGGISDHGGAHGPDLPDHNLYELNPESEEEVIVARRGVLWGCEGRPGSPADEEEDAALDLVPHLNIECASMVQHVSNLEAQGARGYPSQSLSVSSESSAAELSAMWADTKLRPSQRGALAPSHVRGQRDSAAPTYPSGPEGGQPWRNLKSSTKSRLMVSGASQRPSSDSYPNSKSSDEFSKMQPMRVSISRKGRGQARSSCPKEPRDIARHSNIHAQASVRHLQDSLKTFAPRRFTSAVGKEPSGELHASSSRKMQNVVWARGEGRPSYPGAGAVAGGLPRARTRKKEAQEKKSLGGGSRVILGGAFPSWGQRFRAAPLEPASFPPISGIPLLGKSKGFSLLPSGSKPSKQGATGKRSSARRARKTQPEAGEDKGPNSDPVLQAQRPTHWPGPHCLSMHRREFISGDADTRAPEVPPASQPLTVSQGGLPPREPVPSGDQEPTVHAPILERQQPPHGAQGCPQCLVLQKEIDDLKEQLVLLQSLTDKFQTL